MGLSAKYKKSLESQWCLELKTAIPDGGSFDGVVTHNRRQFVVVREFRDLAPDGVLVLPKKHIRGYRDGGFERCANAILRESQALENLRPIPWLDHVETLPELFREFVGRDFWPGVEVIFDDGRQSSFYIGPVFEADDAGFALCCYDANGKWEKVYRLEYDKVARVTLGDSYTTKFNRYMRKHGGKELEKLRQKYGS